MYGFTRYNYEWRRMGEYFPLADGYSLFKNNDPANISINDIQANDIQVHLVDDWWSVMIASMVEYPELIWRMFDTKKYN
jgi:hypothetical protein